MTNIYISQHPIFNIDAVEDKEWDTSALRQSESKNSSVKPLEEILEDFNINIKLLLEKEDTKKLEDWQISMFRALKEAMVGTLIFKHTPAGWSADISQETKQLDEIIEKFRTDMRRLLEKNKLDKMKNLETFLEKNKTDKDEEEK